MKRFPEPIKEALRSAGVEDERSIVRWMVCDRKPDGGFADTYVVLDRRALYFMAARQDSPAAQPDAQSGKTFTGYVEPDRKRWRRKKENGETRQPPAAAAEAGTIPLEEIESAAAVELVGAGMIVVKTKTAGERLIAAYTNGKTKEAGRFVSAVNKLAESSGQAGEQTQDGRTAQSNAAAQSGAAPEDEEHQDQDRDAASCPKCGMMYPEKDRRICPRCMKKGAIFLRVLAMTAPYKGTIALIVLFMLLNSATSLLIPYFSGTVFFDQALGGDGAFSGKLGLVIGLVVVFQTLSLLFSIAFSLLNAKMAAKVFFDLKASVFSSMQRLSLAFFQKKQTGQLMTRINNDSTELQYFFVDGISYFLVNAINMAGILAILLVMDWRLTLIAFLPMPVVLALIRWAFPRLWRLGWRRHRRVSALNSVISDAVRGTRVIKAFGKERQEIERFGRANHSFAQAELSFNRMNQTVFPIIWLITQTSGILIWSFGGWSVMHGGLTFGAVMTFVNYMVMLYGPLQFMNQIAGWWSYCMSAAQRIFEIQDAVPDVAEKPDAVALEQIRGDVVVDGVTFGYEPNKPILKNVSLRAQPGQFVGLVGPSGAGKSTLVNLIPRLYDVSEGEIRIDGMNVKELATESLRRHIGIVSQEVYVFTGTISENIAYANPDCSLEDILHAAKIAGAHDFIEKLPDGYDTIVGTGGHQLSGGEKQRLSIARAVLHNPKILILDEATASLDTETELQIQEALEKLMRGRTTIAIAHRLSTLRNADYLVVMERGSVVEEGTHEELMAKEGIYCGMVRKHDEALQKRGVAG